jgi:hypothetical protein
MRKAKSDTRQKKNDHCHRIAWLTFIEGGFAIARVADYDRMTNECASA